MEALTRPAWNPARQCTGTNRAGERCQRQPIPGGTVCVMHGGAAPQVQHSAKARLLAGADLAIDYLLNLLTPKPPCEHCGRSDGDRDPVVVRACQLVLDRSGFHPTLTVEQAAPPHNEYSDLTEDELIEKTEAMLKRMIESRDFHRAHALPEAVDAVLLDDAFIVTGDDEPEPGDAPPIQDPAVPFPSGNDTPEDGITDKPLEQKDLGDV